ncbi:unnamed protein product [Dicrocoelium dendriticum]|nr:unnamed protein product [Dicrocoelium dendriticum]
MPENYFGETSLSSDEPLDLSTPTRVMSDNHESSILDASRIQMESEPMNASAGRSPAQCEQAFGVFVRKLTEEFLDHRLPISQQSYQNLTHIENACRRSFPQYDARQIRLKVRAQLKLYRRQVKKLSEKTKPMTRKMDKPRTLLPLDGSATLATVPVCQSGELPIPLITYGEGSRVKETFPFNAASTHDTTLLKNTEFHSPENIANIQTGSPETQPAVSICEDSQEPRMDGSHKQNMTATIQADSVKFIVPTDLTKTTRTQEAELKTPDVK